MSRRTPFLSVVYPTCGRPEMLARSITALLANEPPPDQIVVVDQGESDATVHALERLNDPRVVHLRSVERGLSRARNLGLHAAKGDLIGFLDDDCIPASHWVASVHAAAGSHSNSSVWVGKVVHDDRWLEAPPLPAVPQCRRLRGFPDPWRHDPSGGNSVFRRDVFDRLGGFDPLLGQGSTFPGAEDGDMLYRVLRAGLGVSFCETIRCFHLPWRSSSEAVGNRYNYGLGVGAMMAKHVARGDVVPMLWIFVRHFSKKFLLVPWCRWTGDVHRYQWNRSWCRGICEGFRGWRRLARES